VNLLEEIRLTLSTKAARKAANDHKNAVNDFLEEMKRERAIICSDKFCLKMKRQMTKVY
jgi:hypothetical protein